MRAASRTVIYYTTNLLCHSWDGGRGGRQERERQHHWTSTTQTTLADLTWETDRQTDGDSDTGQDFGRFSLQFGSNLSFVCRQWFKNLKIWFWSSECGTLRTKSWRCLMQTNELKVSHFAMWFSRWSTSAVPDTRFRDLEDNSIAQSVLSYIHWKTDLMLFPPKQVTTEESTDGRSG